MMYWPWIKKLAPWVLVCGVGFMAWTWFQNAAEARGRADLLREQRDVESKARRALQIRVLELDSVAQAQEQALRTERVRNDSLQARASQQARDAEEMAVRAGRDLRSSLDSLERSVRTELRPVVEVAQLQLDTLRAAHNRTVRAFQSQISSFQRLVAQQDTSLAVKDRQLATRDSLIPVISRERDLAIQEADELRQALSPGFFQELLDDLPRYAAVGGASAFLTWLVLQ